MAYQLMTYKKGADIPSLPGNNLFHSVELFKVFEQTPGYDPLMIIAYENGEPVGCLLSAVRKSVRWFPPSIIKLAIYFHLCTFLFLIYIMCT